MKLVYLAAILSIISGCAASTHTINSNTCIYNSFVPQNAANDCKKEVCINGNIVSIEDLTETAPVYDWAEEKFCLFHPIDCLRAYSFKKSSQWDQDMTKEYWGRKSLHNGLGDAARHAYLICEMTKRFGAAFTKGLGSVHEEDSSVMFGFGKRGEGNKCCEKIMDLYNNQIGIDLAGEHGSCEENVLSSLHRLRHSLCGE
ncbi:MAG TPA: hypothetical protein VJ202_01070 [Thermodesulfobacteriota bacterium]|nr:hypothetical protein [Thermodesulfobacteriota bacterium]